MYKKLLWPLAMTAVVAVTFGWWNDWDFTKAFTTFKDIGSVGENLKITDSAQKAVNQSKQKAQGFVDSAIKQQKETAVDTINKTKKSLLSTARQQTANAINSLEKTIGLERVNNQLTPEQTEESSSFSFIATVRVNEPASFMIKNHSNKPLKFEINWGDNTQAKGTLQNGKEKLISHSWQIVGDHTITYNNQELLIRVIR